MTIVVENVTLPNLLKPISKSAIVLYRQMIWRIPKSRGGIVIRKQVHMMFCILFSVALLAVKAD
jgi:hypothetical protein